MKRRGLLLAISIFATSSLLPSCPNNSFQPIDMRKEIHKAALLLNDYLMKIGCTNNAALREIYLWQIEKLLELFPTAAQSLQLINSATNSIYTSLMVAVNEKDLELFEILLPYSDLTQATKDFPNFFDFLTKLDFKQEDRAFLSALLDIINDNDDGSLKGFMYKNGYIPLMQALLQDDLVIQHKLVAFLLMLGANPDTPPGEDIAPIFGAIYRGHIPTIAEFVRHNVDLLVLDENGNSAEYFITPTGMAAVTNYISLHYGPCNDTLYKELDALQDCCNN